MSVSSAGLDTSLSVRSQGLSGLQTPPSPTPRQRTVTPAGVPLAVPGSAPQFPGYPGSQGSEDRSGAGRGRLDAHTCPAGPCGNGVLNM
ncbi:hypothetical protein SKAU_G00160200 [Synaphobranchus kaupii]|uniref:Uncharacterized protein n=1 Tax=Synaphobranchus kaupii TaxID=118154 RepID=A0A9Q1FIY0_SYNKA|nr:hypothetical protein SKAU_G00160200 [Synaphobranchus kaupii]